uniref:Uncharacterized protein n=1 Tax=Clastoptera arizonana TaxID=38151 RepID=A0A1B6BZK1_9HEMI
MRLCAKSCLAIIYLLTCIPLVIKGVEVNHEEANDRENLFRKLFKIRRAEQLAAVSGLQALGNKEKQEKMINLMIQNIFAVILKSREGLESSGYIPGVSDFPINEALQDGKYYCKINLMMN